MRIILLSLQLKKPMKGTDYYFPFQIVTKENAAKLLTNFVFMFYRFQRFKKAEVRLLYKKDGRTEKSNYRLISVLLKVSKIQETCLYDQIYSYFGKIFSRCQCGLRKGIRTQHILLNMIEKIKISHLNKQFCAAILTDLSKAFDCIPYNLLFTKLNVYGFDQ